MPVARGPALTVAIVAVVVLVGCSHGDDDSAPTTTTTSPTTTTSLPDPGAVRVSFSCGWEAGGEPAIIVRVDADNSAETTIELAVADERVAHVTEPERTFRTQSVFYVRPPPDWYRQRSTLKITRANGVATAQGLPASDPCPESCPEPQPRLTNYATPAAGRGSWRRAWRSYAQPGPRKTYPKRSPHESERATSWRMSACSWVAMRAGLNEPTFFVRP